MLHSIDYVKVQKETPHAGHQLFSVAMCEGQRTCDVYTFRLALLLCLDALIMLRRVTQSVGGTLSRGASQAWTPAVQARNLTLKNITK